MSLKPNQPDTQNLNAQVICLTLSSDPGQFTPSLVLQSKHELENNVIEIDGLTKSKRIYKLEES